MRAQRTRELPARSLLPLSVLVLCAGLGAAQDPSRGGEDSGADAAVERAPAPQLEWTFRTEVRDVLQPSDAAFGAQGSIYVAEAGAHRISIYGVDGQRQALLGKGPGAGRGELFRPSGVALGPRGEVYVADTGNHRIQVFSAAGEWQAGWGQRGRAAGEFDLPQGIDVRAGRVYVADVRNDRVQVFDLAGEHLLTIGAFGTEEGLFDEPLDVAADEEGRFWVVDAGNSRVQSFLPDGRFERAFGQWGSFPGLLDGAAGVSWSAGHVFVAERHNHRVQVFDSAGEVRAEWGVHALRPREGAGKLHYPNDVAVSSGGTTAVVCEAFEDRFQIFARQPSTVSELMPDPRILGTGGAPHYGPRATTAGDLLVLLEPVTHSVLIFDLDSKSPVLIHTLGSYGRRFGRLVLPSDVLLDETGGHLWVVDRGNRRLQWFALRHKPDDRLRFDPELSFLKRAVELDAVVPASARAGPVDPVAIERDREGHLYVLDARAAVVHVLGADYEYQRSFGGWGTGDGQLREPTDMAWSRDGKTLFVTDADNARVVSFAADGTFRSALGARGTGDGEFTRPFGVCTLANGELVVVDRDAHRIQVFDAKGEFRRAWGTQGLGASEFFKPTGAVQDAKGRLVVIDFGNHRGQFFDDSGRFESAFGARLFVKETKPPRRVPDATKD